MANIQPEIKKIQTATYGEEVRNSFISALEKINSSTGSASIDDIQHFVNEYLDSHPQDLTLRIYAHETHSSGYDADTNPVDAYSDSGVYIDEALDPSAIYIIKNSGGAHIGILLCAHTNGYNRAAQIALYADGRFKYRYRHNSDSVWDNWESLLPFDAVVRNYKDVTPDVTFNMHNTKVDAFLQTEAYDSSDYSYSNLPTADSTNWDRPNTTTITIPSGSSKIVFYDTVTRAERVESTSGTTHTVDNLIPNRNYAYTVRNSSGEMLMHGVIKATGQLRMINAGGDDAEVDRTFNIRDLGGWTATGGKLKYGLVYRGGELNGSISISAAQQAFFKDVLGIRHEIDLRDSGAPGVGATALGCGVNYYHLATGYSPYILGDNDTYAKKRADVIKQLAKNIKNGEPTYIHCQAGADRTGVMCVFLKAICGVSQSDIDRDQELSYYSYQADAQRVRKRNNMWANGHRVMINGTGAENYSQPYINNMEGSSFQDKIIRLLLRSGVTINELNDIRFGLIDGNPTALTNPYGNATITKNLSHVFIDNKDTSVKLYQPFEARVLPNDGYILTSVSVTMGGTDITSTAYNAERILISRVTGDIIITASATDLGYILDELDHTGAPTDEQVATAVSEWLDDHPEATTTVQDGSVTIAKLHSDVIDSTLSTQGAAAEAKTTGNYINILADRETALDGIVSQEWEIGMRYLVNGVETWSGTSTSRMSTKPGTYIRFNKDDLIVMKKTVNYQFLVVYSTDNGSTWTSTLNRDLPYSILEDSIGWICIKKTLGTFTEEEMQSVVNNYFFILRKGTGEIKKNALLAEALSIASGSFDRSEIIDSKYGFTYQDAKTTNTVVVSADLLLPEFEASKGDIFAIKASISIDYPDMYSNIGVRIYERYNGNTIKTTDITDISDTIIYTVSNSYADAIHIRGLLLADEGDITTRHYEIFDYKISVVKKLPGEVEELLTEAGDIWEV